MKNFKLDKAHQIVADAAAVGLYMVVLQPVYGHINSDHTRMYLVQAQNHNQAERAACARAMVDDGLCVDVSKAHSVLVGALKMCCGRRLRGSRLLNSSLASNARM